MARSLLEIILKVTDKNAKKELKELDKQLDQVEDAAKDSSKGIGGLNTDLLKMGAVVGGVTAGVVAAGKAIWELGKRGAVVQQTEESFKGLLKQWDLAPDLLDELRKASRGTVDDMTLMSSTLTLVAGTSQELGEEMLKNAPRLLEVAKAANKLNPSLGDTAFLYESITSGVKRNSKLVLDNLGIIFNQTTAFEEYAKSIGKSTDELTDNERALATLNVVANEAGQNLLDQAGGLDALTDSTARAEVAVSKLKDELSKEFAPVVADVAEGLTGYLEEAGKTEEVLYELDRALKLHLITQDEYNRLLEPFILGSLEANDVLSELAVSTKEYEDGLDDVEAATSLTTKQQLELAAALDDTSEVTEEAQKAADEYAKRLERLADEQKKTFDKLREQKAIKISDFFDVDLGVGDLAARMFDITNFKEFGGEALEIMVREVQAGLAEGKITPEQSREFFKNIAIEAEAIKVKMGEIDATEAAESISDDFNVPIAESKQLIDDVLAGIDLVNSADISEITTQFDALEERKQKLIEAGEIPIEADPQDQAKAALEGLQSQVDYLVSKPWVIEFELITKGNLPGGSITTSEGPGGQHGMDFVVPSGFPNDSFPFRATSGERVTVTPKGQAGGNYVQNVTQNFFDEGAAALGMALVRKTGRDRLNAGMGR